MRQLSFICFILIQLFGSTPIDCCIVDEATQSKEPETLIPLLLGVTKFILVGDPQQLPSVTTSLVRFLICLICT